MLNYEWFIYVYTSAEKAVYGDREWYFFSPLDRKYPNGVRPNRAGLSGYWKATGTDRAVATSQGKVKIGVKKSLVFYKGKNPKGVKTEWIMQEYRLANDDNDDDDSSGRTKNNFGPFNSSMRVRTDRDDWCYTIIIIHVSNKYRTLHELKF